MAHRDQFVEAPLLLRLETSSGLWLHRSRVSCCSPRIIGRPPLESSLTRRSEFCFSGANRKTFAHFETYRSNPTRTSARGTRTGPPPIGGYNVVAIATLIQNNSGRPIRLAGHSMAG